MARHRPSQAARGSVFAGGRRAGLGHATVAKPAHATLNIAVWQGAAPPPLDPMGFRATGGAAEAGGRLRNLRPRPPRWLSADGLAGQSDLPQPAGLAPPGRATRAGPLGEPPRCRRADARPAGR